MIDCQILSKFQPQFDILSELFPSGHFTAARLHRLNEIYELAEAKWVQNLERLRGTRVKYLLIAEAPPWTESGTVRYFYNHCDPDWVNRSWVNRIWRSFFNLRKPADAEQALAEFANVGFLLVDSLPFAEKYSRRRRECYRQLVKECSQFLLERLNDNRIEWSDDVKVALAFKLNGLAVKESFPEGIRLPTGQNLMFFEELICTDGSGYTSSQKLRYVLGLMEGETKCCVKSILATQSES